MTTPHSRDTLKSMKKGTEGISVDQKPEQEQKRIPEKERPDCRREIALWRSEGMTDEEIMDWLDMT